MLFGGKPLTGHSIPDVYGAFEPTAVFVPLEQVCAQHGQGVLVCVPLCWGACASANMCW